MKRNTLSSLLYSVFLLFVISCAKTPNKTRIFPVTSDYEFLGLVYFDDEPCISFVKKQFKPNIKIFNEQGVIKDSISLLEAEKKVQNITDVWMASSDSIFLYSNYNGVLSVIDKNGTILFEKSYYEITDKHGYHYDLLPSHPLYPYTRNKFSDVVFSTWMWSGQLPKSPQERLDDVKNGYIMCKINPFHKNRDSSDILFGVKFSDIEELSSLGDKSFFFAPLYKTYTANNKFFMTSFYSRFLYELSDTLTVEKKIKIIENDAPIVIPIPMDKKGSIQDKANETMNMVLTTMFVTNILYNEASNEYIVLVKNGESDDVDNAPFKIVCFDKNFRKIKEAVVDGTDYNSRKSFILFGNLYVEKTNIENNNKEFEIIPL